MLGPVRGPLVVEHAAHQDGIRDGEAGADRGAHLVVEVREVPLVGRLDDELPTPPWTRAPRRPPRRRRDPLTQQTIVDAALKVLDADGLDPVSMRHVARTLNTSAASLYWHVGSKDGLLDLILDRVIGEQPVPDPDPDHWQEQLKDVARTMRATILSHRDIVRLSIRCIPLGPHALGYAGPGPWHPPRRRRSRRTRGRRSPAAHLEALVSTVDIQRNPSVDSGPRCVDRGDKGYKRPGASALNAPPGRVEASFPALGVDRALGLRQRGVAVRNTGVVESWE